ncbi:MAG TPA: Ig-like domain-containing protein [Gaiellaceae bacterium]|nr:Ig-like domain-containing protein [Gaiellaceae bacterium]
MRTALRAGLVLFALLAFPASALAATTAGQPFPSNLYSVEDATQATGLRVNLPKPDCAARPTDCAEVDVLNTLDGFNIQPRISVPFSGPIDPSTVSSSTVFLVGPGFQKVGINQVVWEPAGNTLHFESDQQLDQTSTYLLVVTNGVHAADGEPLDTTTFRHDLNFGQTKDPALKAYRKSLLDGLSMARAVGVHGDDIAAASLFTTQTITAISDKIRAQIQAAAPPSARFDLGTAGERTVFPLSTITAVQWNRQVGTSTFGNSFLPLPALSAFGPVISTVAFGSYQSRDYETAAKVIPAYGTATGTPVVQATNTIGFTLFVPAGAKPAGGWPVAIFGHGFGDSRAGAPWAVASSLASRGLASIAINVVGHGGGALGRYNVLRSGGLPTVVLSDGGRAIDQNGNGVFDSTEGVSAVGADTLIGNRDGLRQTVIDLMQLVRTLQGGVDVDADSTADLSTSRIYYAGQSFGGIYGVPLLGVEPAIRAGVANVPGGPIIEIARLSPVFRPLVGIPLATRVPPLYNAVPNPTFTNFNENIPLRNEPLRVDTVPGASAIQEVIDNTEWAQQAANPAAYAPHVTAPIIIQFARGDQTVPNPTTSAIIRAGDLQSRTTLYRHDLAFAANPTLGKNPHAFVTSLTGGFAPFAVAAQTQIATFLASDGTVTIDPDGGGPIFETPTSIVPEDLAYIP